MSFTLPFACKNARFISNFTQSKRQNLKELPKKLFKFNPFVNMNVFFRHIALSKSSFSAAKLRF